jgi:predicted metalloprotease with PDZ domain
VLTQFESAGLVKRHHFEGGHSVFELNEGVHHDHILCVKCGRVDEFVDEMIEERQKAIADRLGLPVMGGQGGVVVLDVEQGSPASRIKFQRGDVILQVNRQQIDRVKDLTGMLGERQPQWDFSVRRGDQVFTATVSG